MGMAGSRDQSGSPGLQSKLFINWAISPVQKHIESGEAGFNAGPHIYCNFKQVTGSNLCTSIMFSVEREALLLQRRQMRHGREETQHKVGLQ